MQTIVIEEAFRVSDVDASCALTQAALNKQIDVPVRSRKTGEALNVSNSLVLSKGSIKKPKSGVTDSEGASFAVAINCKIPGEKMYRQQRRDFGQKASRMPVSPGPQAALNPKVAEALLRKSRMDSTRKSETGAKIDRKVTQEMTKTGKTSHGKYIYAASAGEGRDCKHLPAPKTTAPTMKISRDLLDEHVIRSLKSHGPVHDSADSSFGPIKPNVRVHRHVRSSKSKRGTRVRRAASWDASTQRVFGAVNIENKKPYPVQGLSGSTYSKELSGTDTDKCFEADQESHKPCQGMPRRERSDSQNRKQVRFSADCPRNKCQEPYSPHMGFDPVTPGGTDESFTPAGTLTPEGRSEIDETFMSSTEVRWNERTSEEYKAKNRNVQWDLMRTADLPRTTDGRGGLDLTTTADLMQTADIMGTGDITWDLLQSGDVRWDLVKEENGEKIYTRTSPLTDLDKASSAQSAALHSLMSGSLGETDGCSHCPCSGAGATTLRNLFGKYLFWLCCFRQSSASAPSSTEISGAESTTKGDGKRPDRHGRRLSRRHPSRSMTYGRYSRRHQFMMNMIEEGRLHSGRQEP